MTVWAMPSVRAPSRDGQRGRQTPCRSARVASIAVPVWSAATRCALTRSHESAYVRAMKTWDINALEGFPGPPRVLSTTDETRAIVLGLDEGQVLAEHQVHERAWIVVISGHVRLTDDAGTHIDASSGFTFELEPNERHSVLATTTARLLLLLAPWPGAGHPREATRIAHSRARQDVLLRTGPPSPESGRPVVPTGLTPAQKAADRWATDGGRLL